MKKICFICYDFTLKRGGQRAAFNVANGLARKGVEVVLISEFSENEKPAYELSDSIHYYCLINGKGRLRQNYITLCKRANKILESENVDCLISVGYTADILCAYLSNKHKINYAHWEHYSLKNPYDAVDFTSKVFRKIGTITANMFVVLTDRGKVEINDMYHIDQSRIAVIPNWIPDEAFVSDQYNSETKTIISVGNVEKVKGFDRLIEVAKLMREHKGWKWKIFGNCDSEYARSLVKKVEEYGLEDFISFKGNTNDIYNEYADASIFVLTSISECLPMTLLEAKANKLPLVSFDIATGPREIIEDKVNGELVPDGDIEGMARSIDSLIKDKNLRVYYSMNSINGIDKYGEESILKKWDAFFEILCSNKAIVR